MFSFQRIWSFKFYSAATKQLHVLTELSSFFSEPLDMLICAIGSINSLYFHIIGDNLINPIVGVYIPIIRIPY